MLRALLIYLSRADWCHKIVTRWTFARRAASRFIAGNTLEQGIATIKSLNKRGLYATMDHLGENVMTIEEAAEATEHYFEVLRSIAATGVKSGTSLKLSQMGLNIDFDLCLGNVRTIARKAAEAGIFVRIDMEDSSTVDKTFQIFRKLRAEDITNVGLVVQSYLYRTEKDVEGLLREGCRFRLCKGAYKEPADVAYPKKKDVNAAFDRLTKSMIDYAVSHGSVEATLDGKVPPVIAVASHDLKRVEYARQYADQVGLPRRALEFQMLLGIRSDLQMVLVQQGYPVRIYVPYGTHWYPYFMRRLAERPANLWFFLSNLLRR